MSLAYCDRRGQLLSLPLGVLLSSPLLLLRVCIFLSGLPLSLDGVKACQARTSLSTGPQGVQSTSGMRVSLRQGRAAIAI
jgi:hypothetical protein